MNRVERLLNGESKLCLVGLGYVGMPLLVEFSKHMDIVGVDIDMNKISALSKGVDPNGEFEANAFDQSRVDLTTDLREVSLCDIYVLTVPTPITAYKTPDLGPLVAASKAVGQVLKKGDLVIFESTVFPGCTEEVCLPLLVEESGLSYPGDFNIGYSPERINPGDKVHTLSNTMKIVSGDDSDTLEEVAQLYEMIVHAGVHRAPNIKVAESAKIVENVQRDLNIALMNELALIFDKMDISTQDVIEAAGTKWNFHKYYPGLVGGHCISVDPYYLIYKAQELGYYPQVIMSGRDVNDRISGVITNKIVQHLTRNKIPAHEAKVLFYGCTFKENVSDLRNSKVLETIVQLNQFEVSVDIIDPFVDQLPSQVDKISLVEAPVGQYDCLVFAVKHTEFMEQDAFYYESILEENGLFIDVKGAYHGYIDTREYWSL